MAAAVGEVSSARQGMGLDWSFSPGPMEEANAGDLANAGCNVLAATQQY